MLQPGDDVAAIVAHSPPGSKFAFAAGLYRLLEIAPKYGDSFAGEPGAVLSGAEAIKEFAHEGSLFVAAAAFEPGEINGGCVKGRLCDHIHDLFVDNVRQEPVAAKDEVGPGKFFIDFAAHKLYFGSDPAGKTVELARASFAFRDTAENVHISGLVIEKYANAAQKGAIGGNQHPVRWTIEHCEVRYNHGAGVGIGNDSRISHSFIHHNGELGVNGVGIRLVVEDSELSENNQAGYDSTWESGGVKVARTIHVLFHGNYVHDNHGPGLWADIDAVDTVYENNRIENNDYGGIEHEISYEAVIRNNILRDNGKVRHEWAWGAQILIPNSRDVEVYGNQVTVPDGGNGIVLLEQQRDAGPFGPYLLRNVIVRDNQIVLTGTHGRAAGMVTDYAASRIADGGNRFQANAYRVPTAAGSFWSWFDAGLIDFKLFRSEGQELDGSVTVPAPQ